MLYHLIEGRRVGGWGGGGSERCLKWGGGSGGSLRDLSKNILKQRVGKGKSCSQGGGGLKVSPPCPPPRKILIIHQRVGSLQIPLEETQDKFRIVGMNSDSNAWQWILHITFFFLKYSVLNRSNSRSGEGLGASLGRGLTEAY